MNLTRFVSEMVESALAERRLGVQEQQGRRQASASLP
jgi:hypothetical protein